MYRVRFHLAAGPNFRRWQVRGPGRSVVYHDPDSVSLILRECRLVVRPAAAARVHAAGVKDVCGWIAAESVEAVAPFEAAGASVKFDPITSVHWYVGGMVADGLPLPVLVTSHRRVVSPHRWGGSPLAGGGDPPAEGELATRWCLPPPRIFF